MGKLACLKLRSCISLGGMETQMYEASDMNTEINLDFCVLAMEK